jgi:hypothetical protein
MALKIIQSPINKAEREYIFYVMFDCFLGIKYSIEYADINNFIINQCNNKSQKYLTISDIFLRSQEKKWLKEYSLPIQPLHTWNLPKVLYYNKIAKEKIPIIFGKPISTNKNCYYYENLDGAKWGIDIFGSAFFMLTRYEEYVKTERDQLGRFPADASLAFQEGFLERPIINEYLEIFWIILKRLWPGLTRKKRNHRVFLSHDVDIPLSVIGRHPSHIARNLVADLIIRKDPFLAKQRTRAIFESRKGILDNDPCNTFDFIMDISETFGYKSTFNFITGQSSKPKDGFFYIDHPWIRKLMRNIHLRGHLIGFHPSYFTYNDEELTRKEFHKLQQVCAEEKIEQGCWGGRQHYLRWENPTTWQNWHYSSLDYDSTLGFANRIGFRSGICYEYPVYNILTRQSLNLIEIPLLIMDKALIVGMKLSMMEIWIKIIELNRICKLFDGFFTLLWHNDILITEHQRYLYNMICSHL